MEYIFTLWYWQVIYIRLIFCFRSSFHFCYHYNFHFCRQCQASCWGSWSPWYPAPPGCSVQCGSTGIRTSTRSHSISRKSFSHFNHWMFSTFHDLQKVSLYKKIGTLEVEILLLRIKYASRQTPLSTNININL